MFLVADCAPHQDLFIVLGTDGVFDVLSNQAFGIGSRIPSGQPLGVTVEVFEERSEFVSKNVATLNGGSARSVYPMEVDLW